MYDITIDYSELIDAAKRLASERYDYQDIPEEAIASVIGSHLESIIAEAIEDPEVFFRNQYQFWKELDRIGANIEISREETA